MTSICWCTDPHVNFLGRGDVLEGARVLLSRIDAGCDALMITGDISEAYRLRMDLDALADRYKKPIYFVLGNHDYYQGGFDSVRASLQDLAPNLFWLRHCEPIQVAPGVVITGHDGFYDAYEGDPMNSRVLMSDFRRIEELRLPYMVGAIVPFLRDLGWKWADEARTNIRKALAMKPERILFLSHVPPFKDACIHKGEISDPDWLPWFTNRCMGLMLEEEAIANPGVQFDAYCGHTHSPGVFRDLENLTVYTGESEYREPRTSMVLELE